MKMKMKTKTTTKRTTPPTNRRSCASRTMTRIACSCQSAYSISHELGCGKRSTAQKTRGRRTERRADRARLGCSRNAVCGRLNRLGLKRGHKPPTAKPKIMSVSKRRPALLAACAHPDARKVSRKTVGRQPKKFSKRELYAMLADAVRNTG